MAQFYTLEEAANRLAIGTDEFKRKLKTEWTTIRPFRDGATLRFRAADIDELARSLGAASDPGLPLGPVGSTLGSGDDGSGEEPLNLPGTGEADIFSLTGDPDTGRKSGSDSDVRLDTSKAPAGSDPEAALPTEEIALDLSGPASGTSKSKGGSSGKLSASKSGADLSGPDSGAKIPSATSKPGLTGPDSSSEFELSLDSSDSDSFELQLSGDSSEEVDLGGLDQPPPSKHGGQSGINLGKPSDSGVSLEKKGPKSGKVPSGTKDTDSDVDFELSLDSPSSGSFRAAAAKSGPKKPRPEDSSSEFELTLDDDSGVVEGLSKSLQDENKGDIFETDFELPAIGDESGSEVVAVDDGETSGFDVDVEELNVTDDDSSSQVVVVDEDEALVDEDRPRRRGAVLEDEELDEIDLEDEESASRALTGVHREMDEPAQVVVQTPPQWGPLPAIVLIPCVLLLFLGGLMSYEAVRGMWGYHQPSQPANSLVRGVADTLGMKVAE